MSIPFTGSVPSLANQSPKGATPEASSARQTPARDIGVHAPAAGPPPATLNTHAIAQTMEQFQQAIDHLKQAIKPELANSLNFQIDQSTGKTVIKVVDMNTNAVVRQIPSEEMLAIANAISRMQGRSGLIEQLA